MKSTEFLQAAIDVQNQRAADYDSPGGERSMGQTVQAFNAITGRDLTEAEGWLLLQVLKDVRQWSAKGYHHDSALDGVAYSALKAEALCNAPRPIPTDAAYLQAVPFDPKDQAQWRPGDKVRGGSGTLYTFESLNVNGDTYVRETKAPLETKSMVWVSRPEPMMPYSPRNITVHP